MSCNYCDAKFCVLRVEKRCPSCGFSFCPKCLDNTIFVKQLNTHKKVCVKCSQYSSSGDVHVIPPPDFCKKNESEKKNPTKSKSNANKADVNAPSTSDDHKKVNDHGSNRATNSGPSRNDYLSDDWSDDSDDMDLEAFAKGLEIERENQRIADQIHRENYPHLYDKSLLIKIDDTKSTDEILRDAIKQLQTGVWENVEVNRNRPPKCTICSTKALVHCKGCESTFCMKCFDLHADPVCNKYDTLEQQEEN